ncbi:orc1/cdc6 family replication initiation protein [Haloarcula rubripromontorii]|uniref:Orc1/cdc6 family replication initiation protein n=1 Tax=Haloarcula rubripromontorii TaxID=1705562 RepID=A0A0N0U977_9EURY|nr:Cdc6/Cdc18 family protein [Haloarcula rubripromontorii]KOX92810.1 orc1/cdc6 family replication initiation protein [Haloarcula rubripromontorii]
MITDARALRPEYVPRDLHHRDGQINHLSSILAPSALDRTEDICLFGPSGVGKTTIAKFVLGQLEREMLDLRWGYVNCMRDNSASAVLHEFAREVGIGADLRREGTSRSVVIDRLRDRDEQFIAVLDEVAVLDEETLLALYEVPNVSLICITIKEDQWMTSLGQAATSRMHSAATVRLDKYTHAELVDILDARVAHGLVPSRVADDAVEYIADLAAGDARDGIALLRRAAVHVEDNEMRELTTEVVDAIVEDAQREVKQRKIRTLGTHQRLLFRIIDEAGEIDAGTLHARYEERSNSPKAGPTRRGYLRSLKQYELIEDKGNGRGKSYRSLV